MKKTLTFILSLIIALFGLIGCTGRDIDDTDRADDIDLVEGVTISNDGKEIYYGDSKEGKTRLKISYVLAGYGSTWLELIASNFVKDNPQYWVYLDGDAGLTENVGTKLSSNVNLSDIFMPLSSNWQTYALVDWLADLEDVYSAKPDGEGGKTVYEKMNQNWQGFCQASNKGVVGKYAMPWTETVTGFAYNDAMFKKYGWEIPETVNELIALCDKILLDTNGTVKPFVYPGLIGGYFDFIATSWWLQSSGIKGLQEFFDFQSPEVYNYEIQPSKGKLEALEAFVSLFGPDAYKYSVKGSMSKNHTTAQLAFLKGEAAMIPNGNWLETEMLEDLPEGFVMKMMRTPYISTAQKDNSGNYIPINYAATADYMIIPKQAPNIEGAKKFLVYMAKDSMLQLFTKYTGATRPFDYDLTPILDKLTEFNKSCIDIWSSSTTYFDISYSPLFVKGYAKKFITASPYSLLVFGPDNDGKTPLKFCREEYIEAKGQWAVWVENSNV